MRMIWMCAFLCVAGWVQAEDIKPAKTLPETMPWDLKALSAAPTPEWLGESGVRPLYYAGEAFEGKPTRVFAYYATPGLLKGTPELDKNLPGVVLVHGGGGKAFSKWATLWASRGYAAIAMDLGGFGPKGRMSDGGPGQGDHVKFGAIDTPLTDQWTYHAVANVIRAHSLLRSFKEVDADRTGLTGISWGGYLTCIVSGLDNRFKVAIPVYGCGFLHENSVWLKNFSQLGDVRAKKWVTYWDPSMYVGSASMPMLFANGGGDFAYPPDSHAKTYALVKSPKALHFVPSLRHGHIFDRPKSVEVFMAHHLKGGPGLARVGEPKRVGDEVQVTVESKHALSGATLHFTTQPFPRGAAKRTWGTSVARIEEGVVSAPLPPQTATAWFIVVTDERQVTVSSRVVLK